MALKVIYSPNGEMFEVNEERANLLVLNSGWTQIKPEVILAATHAVVPPKKFRKKAAKRVSALDFTINNNP